MYQWRQCSWPLPFGHAHISHLLTSRLTLCLEAYVSVYCSCVVAGCVYYTYIMCMHVVQCSLVVAVALGCARFKIYACDYVSTVGTYTSQLPLWESALLNRKMQYSQPQAMSGDQSDGSSNMSAPCVNLINSKWGSFDITMWCNGMHIRCTTQGCQFHPGHWQWWPLC